ncbi:MAG: hypothetical protein V1688_04775 [bacterium]
MINVREIGYKKIVGVIVLAAWIIFSALYIANDQWQDFQTVQMKQAYQQGVSDSVRALITESAKCAPVPLYDGDKKTEVVGVSCLSTDQNSANKNSAEKK